MLRQKQILGHKLAMSAHSELSLVAFGLTLKRCSEAGVDAVLLLMSSGKGNLVSMASMHFSISTLTLPVVLKSKIIAEWS